MNGQSVKQSWRIAIVLTLAMSAPLASSVEEETADAEIRCNSEEFRSAMKEFEGVYDSNLGSDPAMALEASLDLIDVCPEALSLASRRFQLVIRLEKPTDEQILEEFERVARAFNLVTRAIVPGAIRRPVEYLIDRKLQVDRCVELLDHALVKLQQWHAAWPWTTIPEERAARMEQAHRISEVQVLDLLARAHLALDSANEAVELAERIHPLVLEIDDGPDLGGNIHRSFVGYYWALRGKIAEEEGDLASALEFYRTAERIPEYGYRRESQAKRIWLLMGGSAEDWVSQNP